MSTQNDLDILNARAKRLHHELEDTRQAIREVNGEIPCVDENDNPVPLPDHLRDDVPFAVCDKCGRKSWAAFLGNCGMRQPDGSKCDGILWQTPERAFSGMRQPVSQIDIPAHDVEEHKRVLRESKIRIQQVRQMLEDCVAIVEHAAGCVVDERTSKLLRKLVEQMRAARIGVVAPPDNQEAIRQVQEEREACAEIAKHSTTGHADLDARSRYIKSQIRARGKS